MPPLLQLLRPHQWTKNTACVAGVVFGGKIADLNAIAAAGLTMACFCLAASAMYIFNDLQDLERDRQHPKKKFRPLPSGKVQIPLAIAVSIFLLFIAVLSAFRLSSATLACLVIYIGINLIYSLKLKHLALFDVGCIASGFVLRLLAGIYAIQEIPTASIVLCTFFLAMFLGFAKRRTELAQLQGKENLQRPVLSQYSLPFLDSLVNNAAVMAMVSYALFSTNPSKNPTLVLTLPIVQYAILYYKSLIFHQTTTEEPDQILLRDRRILFSILLWLATYIAIFYGNLRLFR
ncbi:MAG: decaprenyl-phosphate phosphoribosyltransferase [Pseudanabaenaceae cyanobacterium bins.68]|nr:decaprenyl-phosphate phosphoribosyltransferase [Pseudanabaenaceae cyanobacterium bins.68]